MRRMMVVLLAVLLACSADAQTRKGRRAMGVSGASRVSAGFVLQTIATTSTFDPSFAKSGTQTVEMRMSDTTYLGTSFSVVPANRGLTGTKTVAFVFAGGPQTVTSIDIRDDSCTGQIPSLARFTALAAFYYFANRLTGSIPSLSSNTALVTFICSYNQLTGSIPSLTANTALATFDGSYNQLTGNIPSLTANTALVNFYCNSNQLTGYMASTISLTLTNFQAQNNQLPESAINQILADFAANIGSRPTSGTLNLGGTGNAAPTGQGLTDKAAIAARGWTVTTN